MLDPEMDEVRKDKSEFALYRSECSREASRVARERAQQWRLKKIAKMARSSFGFDRHSNEKHGCDTEGASAEMPAASCSSAVPQDGEEARPVDHAEHSLSTRDTTIDRSTALHQRLQAEQPEARSASPGGAKGCETFDEAAAPGGWNHDTKLRKPRAARSEAQAVKPPDNNQKSERAMGSFKRKLRARRPSQVVASHEKEWLTLQKSEKDSLTQAFSRNDSNHGTGCLDIHQLLHALRDFGMKGRTNADREEMRKLAFEQIAMFGDVDILMFAFNVVPQVRKMLRDSFKTLLETTLKEEMECEIQDRTEIPEPMCKGWVEDYLGNPLMGAEAMTELCDCFHGVHVELLDERNKLELVNEAKQEKERCNSEVEKYLDKEWEHRTKGPTHVAFEDFVYLVQMTQERYERLQLNHLFTIRSDLPFHLTRLGNLEIDILPLHNSFRRFDSDKSGTLDPTELNYVLQEFGFLRGHEQEDELYQKIMRDAAHENDGTLTFAQFLQVIYDIREAAKQSREQDCETQFVRFDRDHNGQLSVQEVSVLFQEMGLAPTCRQGQDEIKRLLHNCDEDHSGELDLHEFQHLVQLVSEKLRSINRFREMELGLSLKFTDSQVREYRDFFWDIDKDGNGQLDMQELRTLMHMMRQRIDGDDLRLLMGKIDANNDGSVDFSEFLRLVHAIEQLQAAQDDDVFDSSDDEAGGPKFDKGLGVPKKEKHHRVSCLARDLAHQDEHK